MSDIVINSKKIAKRYILRHQKSRNDSFRYKRLSDVLLKMLANPYGTLRSLTEKGEEFWALNDISFEVRKGEAVGILGRNGAGKSTLLKILSRITEPTRGRVELEGRVSSLLEVGTGFHPELTGRENIYLNGSILGMAKSEVRRKFDEIVAFAEVEKFLDTAVKHYSSGMYVRLAFAVAAHLDPDVLIVDEVLAVGDIKFQKKCLGKMRNVCTEEGRTILFVSHNMTAIQTLCRRAILLSAGNIIADGQPIDVIKKYLRDTIGDAGTRRWDNTDTAPGTNSVRLRGLCIESDEFPSDKCIGMESAIRISLDYWVAAHAPAIHFTIHLINDQGIVVLTSGCPTELRPSGRYHAICRIPGNLLNSGEYFVKLLIVEGGNRIAYEEDGIAGFTVAEVGPQDRAYMGREPGVVQPKLHWQTECVA